MKLSKTQLELFNNETKITIKKIKEILPNFKDYANVTHIVDGDKSISTLTFDDIFTQGENNIENIKNNFNNFIKKLEDEHIEVVFTKMDTFHSFVEVFSPKYSQNIQNEEELLNELKNEIQDYKIKQKQLNNILEVLNNDENLKEELKKHLV